MTSQLCQAYILIAIYLVNILCSKCLILCYVRVTKQTKKYNKINWFTYPVCDPPPPYWIVWWGWCPVAAISYLIYLAVWPRYFFSRLPHSFLNIPRPVNNKMKLKYNNWTKSRRQLCNWIETAEIPTLLAGNLPFSASISGFPILLNILPVFETLTFFA